MRQLIELISEAALIINTEGKIVAANGHLVSLFGYNEDDLLMQEIEILVPHCLRKVHREHVREFLRMPIKLEFGHVGVEGIIKGVTKNGQEIDIDLMLTPIPVENTVIVVAILRDLSKIRKTTKKLQRMLEKLNGH